jgi:uncharacterized protein
MHQHMPASQPDQPDQPRAPGPRQGAAADRPSCPVEYTLVQQRGMIDQLAGMLAASGCVVERFETQLSWVLTAGTYAYKVKKAIRLPFLDFTALAARQFYCAEECRLNRRLAPDLYLDVVPVTVAAGSHVFGGAGATVDYAVRMTAFDQDALWSRRLRRGALGSGEVDALAERLAVFHLAAARVSPDKPWGTPAHIARTEGASLAELDKLVPPGMERGWLAELRALAGGHRHRLSAAFRRRRARGMIRECHGDLHCGNILTRGQQSTAFDGVEFNEGLRWIDVMDDLAFIVMDLGFHGEPGLAARLLSRYLEITGDYDGLAVLPYYRMHRALVRAKVLLERSGQEDVQAAGRAALRTAAQRYLRLARGSAAAGPAIFITHGFSGSGKTTFSRLLVQVLGAVHIRSDVERKRLHGIAAPVPAVAGPPAALYSDSATARTYARLAALARRVVAAGWPVIVDAAFLCFAQREQFRALAAELALPFFLFDLRAPQASMQQRVRARALDGMDASDAGADVLERQQRRHDALTVEEAACAVVVETGAGLDLGLVRAACAAVRAAGFGAGPVPADPAQFDLDQSS